MLYNSKLFVSRIITCSNNCLLRIIIISNQGGARGVMVIVVGNGHGDTSSNPRRD